MSSYRLIIITSILLINFGCTPKARVEKAPPRLKETPSFRLDVPTILKGTVSQYAMLIGYESQTTKKYQPVYISNYGLVVGLQGKGSQDVAPPIRASILAELSKQGYGSSQRGLKDITPEDLVNSMDTAVVRVESIIPQGSVGRRLSSTRQDLKRNGYSFDVRVTAEPSTGVSNLQGGSLLQTRLRIGLPTAGSRESRTIAIAKGPLFVNPYVADNKKASTVIDRTQGTIIGGGEVLYDLPLQLRLADPSHNMIGMITNAINRVFPKNREDPTDTAKGIDDTTINLTIPNEWRDDTQMFVELVLHLSLRSTSIDGTAIQIKTLLENEPTKSNATAAYWRWRSMGERVLSVIRTLYDSPDETPRVAALRAGAALNDPLTVAGLKEVATNGSTVARIEAINLLENLLIGDPDIDLTLLNVIDKDQDPDVRIRAAEVLVDRNSRLANTFQISSTCKLSVIPSDRPLMYITQRNEPRIIVLENNNKLTSPLFAEIPSRSLLFQTAPDNPEDIEVLFRNNSSPKASIYRVPGKLIPLIRFLGRQSNGLDGNPGLQMDYGEIVGTLYDLWKQGIIKMDYRTEEDRILADIRRAEGATAIQDRPDF